MTAHATSPLRDSRRASDEQRLPTASVLIVDDEPGMRRYLEKALTSRFALIECVDSVEQAEALRSRLHFDLILLDIRLPGRDGLEWDEALAADSVSDVVFMTAYADLDTAVRACVPVPATSSSSPSGLSSCMRRWIVALNAAS
ncbi:response regulator [Cobetia crustatorum]|uniref:response regulator n=1 Tax=Cobetia crustatorum TaxID=553385 RepID=UPI0004B90E20|nr:response regulator [Cobetia crustatorum]